MEVKVEIVRNIPPCTRCAAREVVCEGQPGMACLGCAKGHVGCSVRGRQVSRLVESGWVTRVLMYRSAARSVIDVDLNSMSVELKDIEKRDRRVRASKIP